MGVERFYGGKIKFIKTDNLRENSIGGEYSHYLSKEGNSTIKRTSLQKDDVLTTIIGATEKIIGRTSIIQEDILPANINQNIALIRINHDIISPSYVNIYLNTKYGRNLLYFHSRQTEQVNLNCREVERVLVPVFEGLEEHVKILVEKIEDLKKQSKTTYTAAENILLSEIGLTDFTPSNEPVNIKTFSTSFATSGRLDAEYYQRKYEQVIEKITAQPHDTLANVVTIQKSIEPGSAHYAEEGLPFYRVADYSKFGITTPQKYLSSDFVKENAAQLAKLQPKKGSILFAKDGSVGEAYHLTEDINGITSGAILHLRVKDERRVLPEYLTLALNSKLVQMQAERDAGGSIILHWRVSEIENVVVPIIPLPQQSEIAALITQSFALKKQSEHLLDVAKRAVEIAIEQDEAAAMAWIAAHALSA